MTQSLKKYFLIFTGPTLIAFLIAFIVPFFMGLYLSLTKFTTLTNTTWVGLDNYRTALAGGTGFVRALGFTALVSVISIVTVNLGAFALAYLLTRKLRGTNAFRSVFFMPNLIGGIVLGYTWQVMLNAILRHWNQTIVNDWHLGMIGLILLVNWQLMGYMMIIYIAGLQNVAARAHRGGPDSTAPPSGARCATSPSRWSCLRSPSACSSPWPTPSRCTTRTWR